jgi:hypothetical protein
MPRYAMQRYFQNAKMLQICSPRYASSPMFLLRPYERADSSGQEMISRK